MIDVSNNLHDSNFTLYLDSLNFHSRYKIIPYFHNKMLYNIQGNKYFLEGDLDNDCSYLFVVGRMGNGNDRIKYKLHGTKIALILYNTLNDVEPNYLGSIPLSWANLDLKNLYEDVELFLSKRTLFKKIITQQKPVITYEEL